MIATHTRADWCTIGRAAMDYHGTGQNLDLTIGLRLDRSRDAELTIELDEWQAGIYAVACALAAAADILKEHAS